MAKFLVPDDLWAVIARLLPPARPRPKGGRAPIPDRAALTGILFVLRTGLPLGVPAAGDGLRLGQPEHDFEAQAVIVLGSLPDCAYPAAKGTRLSSCASSARAAASGRPHALTRP